jgi:hypothetical protein
MSGESSRASDWHQHGSAWVWVAPGGSCDLCAAPSPDNVVSVQLPSYGVSFIKNPGWEKKLKEATLKTGQELRKEREKPSKKKPVKAAPQSDFGELFDDEDLAG